MDKNIQLFCDADETGKITRMVSGENIIPKTQYRYFFLIDKKEQVNLDKYRIENGELKQIEGTTLIEVESPNPSTEEQLADVKKQLADMQRILDGLTTPPTPTEPEKETPTVPEEPTEPTEPSEETPTETPTEPSNQK